MSELSWPVSEATQEHLQKLMSQGYMTMTELDTCLVPVDSPIPTPVGGDVVACVVFFERGSGVPSHQFLRDLLRSAVFYKRGFGMPSH
jgi:hypothetical protein